MTFGKTSSCFVLKKINLNFTAFDWLTDSIHQTLVKSVRSYLNHSIDDMTCVHCATISAWLFTQQISVLYYFFFFFFFLPLTSGCLTQQPPVFFFFCCNFFFFFFFFYVWPRGALISSLQCFFFFFFSPPDHVLHERLLKRDVKSAKSQGFSSLNRAGRG